MAKVGDFVKPARGGTWRLGVVEEVTADGRFVVRAYVAPANSYEGTTATYSVDEFVVVPLERVIARLRVLRADIVARTQEARQIAESLAAVERASAECACGGSAGKHVDGCALADVLR